MDSQSNKVEKIVDIIKNRMKDIKSSTNFTSNTDENSIHINNNDWYRDMNDLYNNVSDANLNWEVNLPNEIKSHRKITGKLIVFGKKIFRKLIIWYINPPIQQQKVFNAAVTRSLNGLFNYTKNSKLKIDEINSKQIEEINNLKSRMQEEILSFKKHMELNTNEQINQLQEEIKNQNQIIKNSKSEIDYLKTLVKNNSNRISQEKENIEKIISLQVKQLKSKMKETSEKLDIEANCNIEINYLDFENYFRGTEQDISNKMEQYANHFKTGDIVVDIGCGRGELLKLLKDMGIKATGIDLNEDMIELCKSKDLEVYKIDAIEHLNNLPDNFLDGIFLVQVIEHLSSNYLINLIEMANRKLKHGGTLIMETLNPMCLYIFGFSLYIDLTHIRPVHPYTAKYLAESLGFTDVKLNFLSLVPDSSRLLGIPNKNNVKEIDILNDNFRKINEILFSYQDYCIIAKK